MRLVRTRLLTLHVNTDIHFGDAYNYYVHITGERRSLEAQHQSSREIKDALIKTSTQLEQTYLRSQDEQSQIQRLQQVVTSQRDLIKQLAARLVAANVPLSPTLVSAIDTCLEAD